MNVDDRLVYTNHSKLILDYEEAQIRRIVCDMDGVRTIATAIEVIDCNKRFKTRKAYLVEQAVRLTKPKAFQFLHFLN
jgi:3-deoxy-D-arabino-heptulosonate 7-phosphate (DAHP) synthase class II